MNPASPSYRPDWWITTHIGMVGGLIMGTAILLYFVVLIRSLAAAPVAVRVGEPLIPLSEAYHDENIPAVRNFAPWVTVAILLVVLAYYVPISDILKSKFKLAPGYHPDSPVVAGTTR